MKQYRPRDNHNGKSGLKIKHFSFTPAPDKCRRGKKLCGHCKQFKGFGGGYFCHYSVDTGKLRGKVEGDICPYYTEKRCLTMNNFQVVRDKTKPVPREISARIKYLRNQRKEKQCTLAKAIGTSSGLISNWELGNRKPGADSIIKLCNHFNVSADWLLGLSDYQSIRR